MNANGDERIDHDEFVKFMIVMLMGNLQQKLLIAYRCYDMNNDEIISPEEVEVILKNVPLHVEGRYGASFAHENANLSRIQHYNSKKRDESQISVLVKAIFSEFPEGLYFDEFERLTLEVTSELFLSVYDCIYQHIPCVKNFLLMRFNFK